MPCRLKCVERPRKGALFCRAACGALSGADMKQRGSIFSGIFKTGRPWDGRIQRAEACGKAVRCAAKERRQGDPVLRREFFCGAANEREFLRAVILIGCRAAQAGRFVDTLCLFLYD